MDNSLESIENISRRDFLKMKFLLMLYTYFYQFFGVNALAETKLSKIDYSILDKLIKIPFSKEVKEEIHLLHISEYLDWSGNLN